MLTILLALLDNEITPGNKPTRYFHNPRKDYFTINESAVAGPSSEPENQTASLRRCGRDDESHLPKESTSSKFVQV